MFPPLDHPAAVRVERAAVVRASKVTAMDLREKLVKVSVDQAAPVDRKVLLVRAVLPNNTAMVAVRKGCCSKSCHWTQTATEL
jgi:hypothetical protein